MLSEAIILAGGFGTRLQSVVQDLPKPMASVNGRPFLDYLLRYLQQGGIKKAVLSTGYLAEKISAHYQHQFEHLQIAYSHETAPLGTGGGIRQALEQCASEEVLVLNGDSFFDLSIPDFYNFHTSHPAAASMGLRWVDDASRYGTLLLDTTQRVTAFHEKQGKALPGIINAGVYILRQSVFLEHTPPHKNFSIEKDFFETQLATLPVYGQISEGYFIDIGIPEDFEKAQHDFKTFEY